MSYAAAGTDASLESILFVLACALLSTKRQSSLAHPAILTVAITFSVTLLKFRTLSKHAANAHSDTHIVAGLDRPEVRVCGPRLKARAEVGAAWGLAGRLVHLARPYSVTWSFARVSCGYGHSRRPASLRKVSEGACGLCLGRC